ncbi:hypothetical protein MMC07_005909 [Pseudocyphellaria aurata]|nr:hypothetical protein [Pseudocyphellaria aurata]
MGYRDEQSLVFRDETRKVVRKAKAAKTLNKNSSSALISSSSAVTRPSEGAKLAENSAIATDIAPDLSHRTRNQTILQPPSIPIEEHGTCFYFQEFSGRPAHMQAVFKEASLENPLLNIVKSIGMAAMANKFKSPEILFAARERQTSVLRAINLRLQDREEARTNSTMMTILLLGTFEIVTGHSLQSLDSWTSHIMGATALAKIRGKEQLETDTGRRIFYHLRAHVLLGCLQRDVAVPPLIVDWTSITLESESADEIIDKRLFLILARLCALRSDFRVQKCDDESLVGRALAIDADLEDWVHTLPCRWAYITRKAGKTDDIYLGYYHAYRDLWTCTIWNFYRCAHILAHETIIEHIGSHSVTTISPTAQRRRSAVTIGQLSDDIAATVPYYMEGDHFEVNSSYTPKAGVLGQSLLWPLSVVARTASASASARNWAVLQMYKIGRLTGVQQNITIANYLKVQWSLDLVIPSYQERKAKELAREGEDRRYGQNAVPSILERPIAHR